MNPHLPRQTTLFLLVALAISVCPASAQDPATAIDFDRQIAPLLAHRCLACHGTEDVKGGLNLASSQEAAKGGETGVVFVAASPEDSLLWQHVESSTVPPKKPLPDSEKPMRKRWIAEGAQWGTSPIDPHRFSTDNQAGLDWWSLHPLNMAQPSLQDSWCRNPIDAFVLKKLRCERGISRRERMRNKRLDGLAKGRRCYVGFL